MNSYIPPTVNADSFTCPHCGAIAHQTWSAASEGLGRFTDASLNIVRAGECAHCGNHTLWREDEMLYPSIGAAPQPNSDMPETVRKIYLEAASIMNRSPRGAAGLLRLGIQVLCSELGESGHNINSDIASLVAKGLPDTVQKSLDVVRVTGNNAVHPGQIDTDDIAVVTNLFGLINVIIEYMIPLPNRVSGMYAALPLSLIHI